MQEKQNSNQGSNNNTADKIEEQESVALDEKLAELEILRQSLEEKKKQADTYYEQLLRLKAEMENYRKRTEKQLEMQYQLGRETVLVELIKFMDVLEKARNSWQQDHSVDTLKAGMELITQELNSFLESSGLKPIATVKEKFDPCWHEALEQEEREDLPEGEIIRELRRGYTLNGRVIRPAQVVVAKGKV